MIGCRNGVVRLLTAAATLFFVSGFVMHWVSDVSQVRLQSALFEPRQKRYAYVTMHIDKGNSNETFWTHNQMNSTQGHINGKIKKLPRFIPFPLRHFLAKHWPWRRLGRNKSPFEFYESLASVSTRYPLVVMTNLERYLEANTTRTPLLQFVPLPFGFVDNPQCYTAAKLTLSKLRAFALATYDKLTWVDLDLDITENLDHLFDVDVAAGTVLHASRNDCGWDSDGPLRKVFGVHMPLPGTVGVNSGLMVFKPSRTTHDGLVKQLSSMPLQMCPSDQDVIDYYFSYGGRSVRFFSTSLVAFSWCCATTEGRACPAVKHRTR
eukprot:CAMPEP_0168365380 /NCGR_PEP_ID=MMETSP0228-20121227/4689_1 /TAXON_ID=133427 /ORGANISM="Protoceratium reticulatum, Strain CCCM 535 (=CCMP 1889)" /LENGTH=320 /DNA_ID=CAMNT_0008378161 /DNA_START=17 /DNA_END=979 /DNA_ORIENTATION=+